MIALRAAAAGVLLAAAACGSQPAVSAAEEKPDTVAFSSRWHYHFNSLEELIATSDLVVVGEVTAIEPGRGIPAEDPHSGIGYRDVTLTVSETLKGAAPGAAVVIEEAGYDADGSFEYEDMPWSRLGDAGVYFLKHYEGQPANRYKQIHPDGRILTHHRGDDGQSRMYDGNRRSVLAHPTRQHSHRTGTRQRRRTRPASSRHRRDRARAPNRRDEAAAEDGAAFEDEGRRVRGLGR